MMKPKILGFALALACSLLVQRSVQAQELRKEVMPLSNSPSASDITSQSSSLSYRQQQARYVAEQAVMRMEWYKWHGYEPSRPNTNSSYLTAGLYNFQPPSNFLQPTYNYRGMSNAQRRFYRW